MSSPCLASAAIGSSLNPLLFTATSNGLRTKAWGQNILHYHNDMVDFLIAGLDKCDLKEGTADFGTIRCPQLFL